MNCLIFMLPTSEICHLEVLDSVQFKTPNNSGPTSSGAYIQQHVREASEIEGNTLQILSESTEKWISVFVLKLGKDSLAILVKIPVSIHFARTTMTSLSLLRHNSSMFTSAVRCIFTGLDASLINQLYFHFLSH